LAGLLISEGRQHSCFTQPGYKVRRNPIGYAINYGAFCGVLLTC